MKFRLAISIGKQFKLWPSEKHIFYKEKLNALLNIVHR